MELVSEISDINKQKTYLTTVLFATYPSSSINIEKIQWDEKSVLKILKNNKKYIPL